MDKLLVRNYLQKSGMPISQADALSLILAELATRDELVALEQRMDTRLQLLESKLRGEMQVLSARLRGEMKDLRFDLSADMKSMESRLTWRFISGIAFFATVMALLDLFVD